MKRITLLGCFGAHVLTFGCGDGRPGADESTTSTGTDETGNTDGSSDDGESDDGDDDSGIKLDVDPGTGTDDGGDVCWVGPDGEGSPSDCEETAPPDSFDPEIQWTWTGPEGLTDGITLALVGNLDDDNEDGEIDPCDIPEVITLAYDQQMHELGAKLVVLDGATGEEKNLIGEKLANSISPALGDVNGDGRPDIVAADYIGTPTFEARVVAFDADGVELFKGDQIPRISGTALALADLDNDGDVEIYGTGRVFDHEGKTLFDTLGTAAYPANTAADLDGDGDLEVISGQGAMHHDGSVYYFNDDVPGGYPQVANLDDDDEPEILLTTEQGFWVLEHDGTVAYGPLRPTGDPEDGFNWQRPAVIHDFDADGLPEFGQSSRSHFATYERDGTLRWSAEVEDNSGLASATAFDFLGDGSAEAMYADESIMSIFDDQGTVELEMTRTSGTWIEYPVVADIDNDGSAEIVITSNRYQGSAPTVQVIRDKEDRWIQARRIWNQHTYHVTNVREDGTIPTHEEPSWENLNTFRSNAQIEGGGVCIPPAG